MYLFELNIFKLGSLKNPKEYWGDSVVNIVEKYDIK